jgi:hypothetical protein
MNELRHAPRLGIEIPTTNTRNHAFTVGGKEFAWGYGQEFPDKQSADDAALKYAIPTLQKLADRAGRPLTLREKLTGVLQADADQQRKANKAASAELARLDQQRKAEPTRADQFRAAAGPPPGAWADADAKRRYEKFNRLADEAEAQDKAVLAEKVALAERQADPKYHKTLTILDKCRNVFGGAEQEAVATAEQLLNRGEHEAALKVLKPAAQKVYSAAQDRVIASYKGAADGIKPVVDCEKECAATFEPLFLIDKALESAQ